MFTALKQLLNGSKLKAENAALRTALISAGQAVAAACNIVDRAFEEVQDAKKELEQRELVATVTIDEEGFPDNTSEIGELVEGRGAGTYAVYVTIVEVEE